MRARRRASSTGASSSRTGSAASARRAANGSGRRRLKGYTKGEQVLRFEAIVHNTRALGCGRVLEKFPEIVDRLAAIADRFCTMLDCVDVGFIGDATIDGLPTPSRIGCADREPAREPVLAHAGA